MPRLPTINTNVPSHILILANSMPQALFWFWFCIFKRLFTNLTRTVMEILKSQQNRFQNKPHGRRPWWPLIHWKLLHIYKHYMRRNITRLQYTCIQAHMNIAVDISYYLLDCFIRSDKRVVSRWQLGQQILVVSFRNRRSVDSNLQLRNESFETEILFKYFENTFEINTFEHDSSKL